MYLTGFYLFKNKLKKTENIEKNSQLKETIYQETLNFKKKMILNLINFLNKLITFIKMKRKEKENKLKKKINYSLMEDKMMNGKLLNLKMIKMKEKKMEMDGK